MHRAWHNSENMEEHGTGEVPLARVDVRVDWDKGQPPPGSRSRVVLLVCCI